MSHQGLRVRVGVIYSTSLEVILFIDSIRKGEDVLARSLRRRVMLWRKQETSFVMPFMFPSFILLSKHNRLEEKYSFDVHMINHSRWWFLARPEWEQEGEKYWEVIKRHIEHDKMCRAQHIVVWRLSTTKLTLFRSPTLEVRDMQFSESVSCVSACEKMLFAPKCGMRNETCNEKLYQHRFRFFEQRTFVSWRNFVFFLSRINFVLNFSTSFTCRANPSRWNQTV